MGDKYEDLRAAIARADEAIGCSPSTPHIRVELHAFAALYKAAKALVDAEEPRERWVDAQANLASAIGLDNTIKTCWCHECLDDPSMGLLNPTMVRMITCPQCGNKRCPRATSHDNACSGSNDPGQDGSRYK